VTNNSFLKSKLYYIICMKIYMVFEYSQSILYKADKCIIMMQCNCTLCEIHLTGLTI